MSSRNRTPYHPLGFDPWTAEFAITDYAAPKLSRLVYRFLSLVLDGYDVLADAIGSLRKTRPIEIEPVKVARPAQLAEQVPADERAAA